MVSSGLLNNADKNLYMWKDNLDSADYVEATYYIETSVDPELASIAMAKEQSASTPKIPGIDYDLSPWTARVTSIEILSETEERILPAYRLNTPVYQTGVFRDRGYWCAKIRIAFPIANFGLSLTNLWNAAGGELYRLGFLNTIKLMDLGFPESFLEHFPGPIHGAYAIKSELKINNRPILCRSTRPAVGLTTEIMLKINEKVLRGGFDAVKDDELTCDSPLSPFADRIKRMVDLVRRMEDETGEKKYYIANVIGEDSKTFEFADLAAKAGVNAILVSPTIQGFTIAGEIARRTGLAILCHNSWEDILTRHPKFGISSALYLKMQRICGVDMVMFPGAFSTDFIDKEEAQRCVAACMEPLRNIKSSLPILAGGKSPDGLSRYVKDVGSTDFMLIVASAVDNHPDGIEAGARDFRNACKKIKTEGIKNTHGYMMK